MVYINFLDRLRVRINSQDSREELFLKKQYLPYVSTDEHDDNVTNLSVDIVKKIKIVTPLCIGKEAIFENEKFFIVDHNKKKILFNFGEEMVIEEGFSLRLLEEMFHPWLLANLIGKGIMPVHGSSVYFNKEGILFTGWGGVGKTRMLLRYLDGGAEFIGDEWVLMDGKFIYPFKGVIELCDYDMNEYPQFVKLSFRDKIRKQLNCFSKIKLASSLLSGRRLNLTSKFFQASDIFSKTAPKAVLSKTYLLERSNFGSLKNGEIETNDAVRKLSEIFLRENKKYFYYRGLFRYAFPVGNDFQESLLTEYKERLNTYLENVDLSFLILPTNFNYSRIQID